MAKSGRFLFKNLISAEKNILKKKHKEMEQNLEFRRQEHEDEQCKDFENLVKNNYLF